MFSSEIIFFKMVSIENIFQQKTFYTETKGAYMNPIFHFNRDGINLATQFKINIIIHSDQEILFGMASKIEDI